jgi:hypothetical protein
MGKGISKPVGAHEPQPVSLSELIHQHVRVAIETAVHEELRDALGTIPYEPLSGRIPSAAKGGPKKFRRGRQKRLPVAAVKRAGPSYRWEYLAPAAR